MTVVYRGASDDEKAAAARLRAPALRCLAPFLGLPDEKAKRVLLALREIVNDLFPVRSRELRPGSTQARACTLPHRDLFAVSHFTGLCAPCHVPHSALCPCNVHIKSRKRQGELTWDTSSDCHGRGLQATEYATLLLAIMDAGVAAAEQGTQIEFLLEVGCSTASTGLGVPKSRHSAHVHACSAPVCYHGEVLPCACTSACGVHKHPGLQTSPRMMNFSTCARRMCPLRHGAVLSKQW